MMTTGSVSNSIYGTIPAGSASEDTDTSTSLRLRCIAWYIMARTSRAVRNKEARKRKSDANQEARIQGTSKALTRVTYEKFKSIAAAARHYKVPYDTLPCQHKFKTNPRVMAHAHRQLLTVALLEHMARLLYGRAK